MKFLILLSLVGCGAFSKGAANILGQTVECVGGVVYYQFPSGVTVAYNPDGTIKTCK
jgi:hypothetical protein